MATSSLRRNGSRRTGPIYIAPMAVWMSLLVLAPMVIVLGYSFLTRGVYGGVEPRISLEAYRALANPLFLRVAWRTLRMSVSSTVLTMALALPSAYFMVRSGKSWLILLVIVPFWTNFLIRIYAWIAILGNNGFLNGLFLASGLLEQPLRFLYNRQAVVIVLVYTYLPYAILPLYSTIERFDFSLLDEARDLGANNRQSLLRVFIPGVRGGIFTAVLFTAIPTFGAYAVPQLIGGQDSFMLGNIIARELTVTRNWPLSAAISVMVTLVTTIALVIYLYLGREPRRREVSSIGEPPTPGVSL